jgi:hypothetical protein
VLYLHCVICGRKQADGLLSGSAWGKLELPAGASVHHPSVRGTTARVCPSCIAEHADWENRALAVLGLSSGGLDPPLRASA